MKFSQGVIKEFSVDDKGTVMVGALGLPPITGSNPSARACMTAIKIMKGIEVRLVCEDKTHVYSPPGWVYDGLVFRGRLKRKTS